MRYLKSKLFSVGLVLTIAGVAATYFGRPVVTRWSSSGGGTNDFGFHAEYTDVNGLPIASTVSGLVVMATAVARTRLKP
jgi:hypothetical protein